jgi:hypothetical protein
MTSPYELRFSIFNSAKDLLEKQYKSSVDAWEVMDATAKQLTGIAPQFPTMEEIVEKAIEINKFVSDSNERELTKIVRRATNIGMVF